MSYKEEYYHLIENYTFYHLPNQEIINSDERVALAIIKNYQNKVLLNEYENDEYNRYKEIKFNEILDYYKTNKSFWKKADIHKYLLEEDFRSQFPEISFQFLNDKDFLLKIFNRNKNQLILDSLNTLVSKEEFEKLEKSFLLSKYPEIESVKKYEKDEEFIKQIIKKNPHIYDYLSDNIKENESVIEIYLEYENSILTFPKEKQNKYFIKWAKLHKNWNMKIIDQLDYEYLKPIMKKINKTNNENLLEKLLSRNFIRYKEIIVDFFNQNNNTKSFFKMIKEKPLLELMPIINEIEISQYLTYWINNYSYEKLDKFDFKILELINNNKKIKTVWESSFDYKIMNKIEKNQTINFEIFKEALDIQFNKLENNCITYEKLETNMIKLKKHLPIETLKEMKVPSKNIVEYLQHIKFEGKFKEKNKIEKKLKI